jgi:uncharacterized membrane protein
MPTAPPIRASQHRWRIACAGICGAVAFGVSHTLRTPLGLAGLIGWNATCVVFLFLTIWLMLRDDEATVRARAAIEDEHSGTITIIILAAVAASLAATLLALHDSKAVAAHARNAYPWPIALSVSTLMLSWMVIQTVFTLRYAHRYFGDSDQDGTINGGVKFPGDAPKDYRDFIYMAVCIGCTSQVSDFNITNTRFRSLVTAHAIVAFSFNVTVLALGINMVASLLGQ